MEGRAVRPPPYRLLALESLFWLEYATFVAWRGLLRFVPDGDGHPVLVLPGFTATDRSTGTLRAALRRKGYWVHGWRLGSNVGPHRRIVEGVERRLIDLHERHATTVSLVGWSLGGIYARELARLHPGAVRQVITLGSPFRLRPPDRSRASVLYDMVAPREDTLLWDRPPEHRRPPLDTPTTAIYTRMDGVVRWHACIEQQGPQRENVEVGGTHSGLGYNVTAVFAVTDRLAQREGTWAPFRAPLPLRHLYPRPADWDPARRAVVA